MDKRFSSITEQVAQVLRDGLLQGRWRGTIPGRIKLAAELGVNHKTVQAALRLLEQQGILVSKGAGRERAIVGSVGVKSMLLRVAILLYEPTDRRVHYIVDLRHQLAEAGHSVRFVEKTMREMGMDVNRIARFVEKTEADAWVVVAGTKDVLSWFAEQRSTTTFALFGRLMHVPLASTSPRKAPAFAILVSRLVELGHKRIVMLVRDDRRKPSPGFLEQFFLDELEKHGIRTGAYNLPDWDDGPDGLRRVIESLFRHTPPTALIISEPMLFHAVRDHLARKGIHAPEHVSLICDDDDPTFEWCRPAITHIRWDHQPIVRRVVQWANHVAMGTEDRRKTSTDAGFVEGGTIGPANAWTGEA